MGGRRKRRPAINSLTKKNPESEVCCWFCGNTMNVPPKKYDGMCMSCWWEFNEDDIALELWGVEVMA